MRRATFPAVASLCICKATVKAKCLLPAFLTLPELGGGGRNSPAGGKVHRGRVLGRNQILQSMRGIAAMMVVYGHAVYLMPMQTNAALTTQVVLFEANSAAVFFFFVLSGFDERA